MPMILLTIHFYEVYMFYLNFQYHILINYLYFYILFMYLP